MIHNWRRAKRRCKAVCVVLASLVLGPGAKTLAMLGLAGVAMVGVVVGWRWVRGEQGAHAPAVYCDADRGTGVVRALVSQPCRRGPAVAEERYRRASSGPPNRNSPKSARLT
jgi:hypothetical protein